MSRQRTATVLDEMWHRMLIERVPEQAIGLGRREIREGMIREMPEEDANGDLDDDWCWDVLLDGIKGFNEQSDLQIAKEYWQRYCTGDYLLNQLYTGKINGWQLKPLSEWEDNSDWNDANSLVYALRMYILVEQTRMQAAVEEWVEWNNRFTTLVHKERLLTELVDRCNSQPAGECFISKLEKVEQELERL